MTSAGERVSPPVFVYICNRHCPQVPAAFLIYCLLANRSQTSGGDTRHPPAHLSPPSLAGIDNVFQRVSRVVARWHAWSDRKVWDAKLTLAACRKMCQWATWSSCCSSACQSAEELPRHVLHTRLPGANAALFTFNSLPTRLQMHRGGRCHSCQWGFSVARLLFCCLCDLLVCRGFSVTRLILFLTYVLFCALVKAQCPPPLLNGYLMYKRLFIRGGVIFAHLCLPLSYPAAQIQHNFRDSKF